MALLENQGMNEKNPMLLESIFKNVTDAILVIDRAGFIMKANTAALKMTGLTEDELENLHFCDVCRGVASHSEEATCAECFKRNFSLPSFEMRVRAKDGSECQVAASSTHFPEGEQASLVLILRDMSEQHQKERERYQRMLTNYVIQAQEEERKRVSRDLHDGIGQSLYSVIVGLKILDQLPVNEDVKKHLTQVQQMTVSALEEVKTMAVELRPSALDDLGLVPAIRTFLKRFGQTFGIVPDFEVSGANKRYASVVETALYRICQEALTNAAKYADTEKISISLVEENGNIRMEIRDHGKGFDISKVKSAGTGLGLYGMRERASLLGGEVKIESIIDYGTTIHVTIPINEKGEPAHVDPDTYRR